MLDPYRINACGPDLIPRGNAASRITEQWLRMLEGRAQTRRYRRIKHSGPNQAAKIPSPGSRLVSHSFPSPASFGALRGLSCEAKRCSAEWLSIETTKTRPVGQHLALCHHPCVFSGGSFRPLRQRDLHPAPLLRLSRCPRREQEGMPAVLFNRPALPISSRIATGRPSESSRSNRHALAKKARYISAGLFCWTRIWGGGALDNYRLAPIRSEPLAPAPAGLFWLPSFWFAGCTII